MSSAHGAGVPEDIDAATAKARTTTGESWLLDVREDDEWAAGHSAVAHHIPMGELQARVDELPADGHIAVVCRSGHRSSSPRRPCCAGASRRPTSPAACRRGPRWAATS
ncbi:rhodanese-like domain-containing protein [Clavibacter tessellarius]|uniref:rhodanese-like domain-containing protein n=1 Tax=Clavibacter tessellarius TaxID=31965 RepID=UPI0039BFD485